MGGGEWNDIQKTMEECKNESSKRECIQPMGQPIDLE